MAGGYLRTASLVFKKPAGSFFVFLLCAVVAIVLMPASARAAAINEVSNISKTLSLSDSLYRSVSVDGSMYENLTLAFNYDSRELDASPVLDSFTYGWTVEGVDHELGVVPGIVGSSSPLEVSSSVVPLPADAHKAGLTIYVRVQANSASDTVKLTGLGLNGDFRQPVDSSKPSIGWIAPASDESYNPATITVSAQDETLLKSIHADIYDQTNTTLLHPCTKTAAMNDEALTCDVSQPDGTYVIRAYATDMANNSSDILTRTIIIDTVAPSSTNNLGPHVGTLLTTRQVIADVSPRSGKLEIWKLDDEEKEDTAKHYTSPEVAVDASNAVTYMFDTQAALFGNGVYKAVFTAWDEAGNSSANSVTFTLNNAEPGGEPSVPTDGNQPEDEAAETDSGMPSITSNRSVLNASVPVSPYSSIKVSSAANRSSIFTIAVASASNNRSTRSVLGTSSKVAQPTAPAVEPSVEGWKIIGLSWYWWLAIVAGIVATWLLLAALIRRMRNTEA